MPRSTSEIYDGVNVLWFVFSNQQIRVLDIDPMVRMVSFILNIIPKPNAGALLQGPRLPYGGGVGFELSLDGSVRDKPMNRPLRFRARMVVRNERHQVRRVFACSALFGENPYPGPDGLAVSSTEHEDIAVGIGQQIIDRCTRNAYLPVADRNLCLKDIVPRNDFECGRHRSANLDDNHVALLAYRSDAGARVCEGRRSDCEAQGGKRQFHLGVHVLPLLRANCRLQCLTVRSCFPRYQYISYTIKKLCQVFLLCITLYVLPTTICFGDPGWKVIYKRVQLPCCFGWNKKVCTRSIIETRSTKYAVVHPCGCIQGKS